MVDHEGGGMALGIEDSCVFGFGERVFILAGSVRGSGAWVGSLLFSSLASNLDLIMVPNTGQPFLLFGCADWPCRSACEASEASI